VESQSIVYPTIILITGILVVLVMLIKLAFNRAGLPAIVGYLILGVLLRVVNEQWGFLGSAGQDVLFYLGTVGLTTLLFRVGLESNLRGLLKQLPKASLVGSCNLVFSGLVGYLAAIYVLDMSWITALIVGVALSATSVGISVAAWQDSGDLNSPQGEFLLDVAEFDDISAVLLMALLFILLPEIHQGGNEQLITQAMGTLGLFSLKILLFGLACFLFSHYMEKPLTHFFVTREASPDPMLSVVGIGFIFAATAGLLGFSVAIGAFFAGLVFSRDPDAVKMEASFQPIYEIFTPFFFIGVGLEIDPAALGDAVWPGLILLVAAVLGKLAANGIPLYFLEGSSAALLIGVSMIPRAEIALVVMSRGRHLGDWAVPENIYSAMVLVCAVTCLAAPLTARRLLKNKHPQ